MDSTLLDRWWIVGYANSSMAVRMVEARRYPVAEAVGVAVGAGAWAAEVEVARGNYAETIEHWGRMLAAIVARFEIDC